MTIQDAIQLHSYIHSLTNKSYTMQNVQEKLETAIGAYVNKQKEIKPYIGEPITPPSSLTKPTNLDDEIPF